MLAMESVYHVLVHVLNPIQCAPRTAAVGVPVLLVLCSMMRALSVSTHAPAPENVSFFPATFGVLFIFIASTHLYIFTAVFGIGVYHNQTYQPGDKWNCTESDECMFW